MTISTTVSERGNGHFSHRFFGMPEPQFVWVVFLRSSLDVHVARTTKRLQFTFSTADLHLPRPTLLGCNDCLDSGLALGMQSAN